MMSTHRLIASAAALFMLAGAASAQSRSSFQLADAVGGVSITPSGLLDYTVTESLAPTLLFGGNLYTINSIFGFWVLSDDDNLTPVNPNFLDGDGATWGTSNNNGGAGGIAGWATNPNTGITPGQSVAFSFSSLAGSVEGLGLHIRVNETLPGGGNTAFFVVPTPGAAALLGLGGLTATRRRRR